MRAEEAAAAKARRLREGHIAVPHQGRQQAGVQHEAALYVKVEQDEVCEGHEGDADGEHCRRGNADVSPSNAGELDHVAPSGRALVINDCNPHGKTLSAAPIIWFCILRTPCLAARRTLVQKRPATLYLNEKNLPTNYGFLQIVEYRESPPRTRARF